MESGGYHYPMNYYIIAGDVFIDNQPSSNPPFLCGSSCSPDACYDTCCPDDNWMNCIYTMAEDFTGIGTQLVNCSKPCNPGGEDCNSLYPLDWPFEWKYCTMEHTCYELPTDDELPGRCVGGDVSGTEGYVNSFPNYCLDDVGVASGNCDAIATMYQGQIVGYDFVGNSAYSGTVESAGTTLMAQHSANNWGGYPSIGDTIDDLLLYKASTGTYHRLTDESYNEFFNSVWDSGTTGPPSITAYDVGYIITDLHFGPPLEEGQTPQPFICRTDEDCIRPNAIGPDLVCHAGQCVQQPLHLPPQGQCYCECTGDDGVIQTEYPLGNGCYGDEDCTTSCSNYCPTIGLEMSYSQCIQEGRTVPSRQTKIRQKFKGNYLLTYEETNRIKTDNLVPLDLRNIDGYMQCLGKNNSYPCYWVTENNIEAIEDRKNKLSLVSQSKIFDTNERILKYKLSKTVAHYNFHINDIEKRYNIMLNSDYSILAECSDSTIVGVENLYEYNSDIVSVTVMGIDNNTATRDYCKLGQLPTFYIYNRKTKQELELNNIVTDEKFYPYMSYNIIL